jgi:hypothetical protein
VARAAQNPKAGNDLEVPTLVSMNLFSAGSATKMSRFDIAFAFKKVAIPGFRKALTEEDRFTIAKTVVKHLKLSRWEFSTDTRMGLPTLKPT